MSMADAIEYFDKSLMHLLLSSLKHSDSIKIFTSGVVCGQTVTDETSGLRADTSNNFQFQRIKMRSQNDHKI